MKSRWDIKSILVGTLIGAAGLALLGAAETANPPSGPIGRYQVAAAGAGPGELVGYVVDTVTGQVWTSKAPGFQAPKNK